MQFDLSEFREFPPQQNGHAQPMLSINEKGTLAMNRAFLQKLGEVREFRAYTHETGYQILLFPEKEPNVRFARAGGTAKNAQLAADLKGLGYRFPVRYDFRWDQESRVWAGTCQEMAEPPKDLAANRAKRRRRIADSSAKVQDSFKNGVEVQALPRPWTPPKSSFCMRKTP